MCPKYLLKEKPFFPNRGVYIDWEDLPPSCNHLTDYLEILSNLKYNLLFINMKDRFPWSMDSRFSAEYNLDENTLVKFTEMAIASGISVIPVVPGLDGFSFLLCIPGFNNHRIDIEGRQFLDILKPGGRKLIEDIADDLIGLFFNIPYLALDFFGAAKWFSTADCEDPLFGRDKLITSLVSLLTYINGEGMKPVLFLPEDSKGFCNEIIKKGGDCAVFVFPSSVKGEDLSIVPSNVEKWVSISSSMGNGKYSFASGELFKGGILRLGSLFSELNAVFPLQFYQEGLNRCAAIFVNGREETGGTISLWEEPSEVNLLLNLFVSLENEIGKCWQDIRGLHRYFACAAVDAQYHRKEGMRAMRMMEKLEEGRGVIAELKTRIEHLSAGMVEISCLETFLSGFYYPILEEYYLFMPKVQQVKYYIKAYTKK